MQFNYAKEKAKFEEDWAEDKKLLQSQNASEELIEEIYQVSLGQFNSDRNYYLHKEEFSSEDELSEEMDLGTAFDFIEQFEDAHILKVLKMLKKSDYEIIIMLCEKGMTQAEIARQLGQTRGNISIKIKRIKKLFENT